MTSRDESWNESDLPGNVRWQVTVTVTSSNFRHGTVLSRVHCHFSGMPPSRSLQLLTIAGRITSIRGLATRASSAYLSEHSSTDPSTSTSPKGLSPAERNVLESALRVDQAGEIAANWIYAGQLAVLKNNRSVAPLIQVRLTAALPLTLK